MKISISSSSKFLKRIKRNGTSIMKSTPRLENVFSQKWFYKRRQSSVLSTFYASGL